MKAERTMSQSLTRVAIVVGVLLMIPLVAMQFTDEVVWTPSDFVIAFVLLFGTGLLYVLGARKGGSTAYRLAVAVALGASLFLVWANMAVGIIGSEDNPANLMYLGVLAVGAVGAALARLRAQGMALALVGMALAQGVIAAIVLVNRLGFAENGALDTLKINGFFAALFIGSAVLFQRAAQAQAPTDARLAG